MTAQQTLTSLEENSDNSYADEYIILFRSCETHEQIVLHRNMHAQIEYVIFTPTLLKMKDNSHIIQKNFFMMDEYGVLLRFKGAIMSYLDNREQLKLFHAFFRMSTSEFFDSIPDESNC